MDKIKKNTMLLASVLFTYVLIYLSFENIAIFWYLYTFTMLVCMAIAVISEKFEDQLPTWHYLLFGIGYGTIIYGIIRLGYWLISFIDKSSVQAISRYINDYGPSNIWHYLLLIFFIIVGEELFWRGYVQQQLKQFLSPFAAVLIMATFCAIAISLSGFLLGAVVAFVVSIVLGLLYEWRKSMPLIIVSHIVFILLLFLVLPLQ